MQKRSFMLILVGILIVGCKSKQTTVALPPVKHVERKVTELVPFYIPADSTTLSAFFECDSTNNVLLKWLSENKSPGVDSETHFKNGLLDHKAKVQPDTVYLPIDSVIVEREIPYAVEVEKIEHKQTKLQHIFYLIGIITTTAVAVWLLTKIGLKRII